MFSPKFKEKIKIEFFIHDDNDEISLGTPRLLKNKLPYSADELEDEIILAETVLEVVIHNKMIKDLLNSKEDPMNPDYFGRCSKCKEMTSLLNPCCNAKILYKGSSIDPDRINKNELMREFPDGKIN